ncbi:MAG TPA: hypothetical protein VEI82_06865, partial [Myxococcota bacterium]|nr:hypothetical protein [Myxococcota bacterium]
MLLTRLNHDTAWCFAAARRLLGGERLYVDILEVNPPLIFWLMAPAAWLGQTLGIPDGPAAYLLHALSLVAATLAAGRVLALEPAPERWIRSSLLCAFVFLVTVPSVHDLGQRDLLAGILLLPYALLAGRVTLARRCPPGVAIACGALGAVGVALKPFFVIPWLAVELVVLWRRRSLRALWRIDAALVVLGQAVYAALVLAVTPAYVWRIVPLASATYGAFNVSRLELVTRWVVPALWLCGLGALVARRRLLPEALALPPVETLLAAALGFFTSYVVQGKGFGYHLLPVLVFAALALLCPALGALRLLAQSRRGDPGLRPRAIRAILACAFSGSLVALFLTREVHTAFVWIRAGYPPEV